MIGAEIPSSISSSPLRLPSFSLRFQRGRVGLRPASIIVIIVTGGLIAWALLGRVFEGKLSTALSLVEFFLVCLTIGQSLAQDTTLNSGIKRRFTDCCSSIGRQSNSTFLSTWKRR